LVFLFVAVATYRLTPRYTAVASIVTNNAQSAFAQNGSYAAQEMRAQDLLFNIQTQMDLLTSRQMAESVVDKMDLIHSSLVGAPLPPTASEQEVAARKRGLIGMVAGGLVAKPRRGSRLIDLTFESQNPIVSAEILNGICEAFVQYDLDMRKGSTRKAAQSLDDEMAAMKTKVEDSQRKLVEYLKDHPIMQQLGGDKGESVTINRLGGLSKSYMEAQDRRIAVEARLHYVRDGSVGAEIGNTSGITPVQALVQKKMELNQRLKELLAEWNDNAPIVQTTKDQLALVEKEIETQTASAHKDVVAQLENQYNSELQREKEIKTLLDKARAEAMDENSLSIQYEILKQDADANQKLFTNMLSRLKEANLTAGMQEPSVRIVDRAQIPQFRSYPPVSRNLAMGGILGIGFGIGLVFLLDYLDNTLKTTEDVNRILQLPALGVIPALGTLNKRRLLGAGGATTSSSTAELISDHPAESGYAEAYRSLRTSVLLSLADHKPKTILVTSPQPSEGKTTTAINIAIALAQTGVRVLIIDADMRRPRCHKALGVANKHGLSTFLSAGGDLDRFILETASGVQILPCGPPPPNPSELLTSSRMLTGLRELEGKFDHIVIDSPPVATVSDGLILAKSVDGVVLVVQGNQTSRTVAMRARQMLVNVGAKVFGVVLNKVDAGSSYYYDYYYKYGYYYSRDVAEGDDQQQLSN
jgi:capsular exopolysaccharide synthesis family protein